MLCVLILCFVNQRKGSATGAIQVILPNVGIISLALLLIPSMKMRDFEKLRYLIWLLVDIISTAIVTVLFYDKITEQFHILQWWTGAISLTVWGLLFIKAVSDLKGRNPGSVISTHGFQLVMSLVLLLFSLSANDQLWPWQYLLVYTTMVLTEIDDDDRKLIVSCMENSILISFFVIQGLAFAFRPYDQVRYLGLFSNPNINALFYLTVYICFISKYCSCYDIEDSKKRKICRMITLAFSGAMWGFVFLTGSRCTILAMGVTTAMAGIYCLTREKSKIILRCVTILGSLLLWIALSFPVVFCAVRYIPPIFHHPIWFNSEYSETKVHSFDAWNSEKYIDFNR